jgi:hypothetical protein
MKEKQSFAGKSSVRVRATLFALAVLACVSAIAGPSVVDIPKGCFMQTYDNGLEPGHTQSLTSGFNAGSLRSLIIDALMGWTDPSNNCGTDEIHPTPASTYNTPAAQAYLLDPANCQ